MPRQRTSQRRLNTFENNIRVLRAAVRLEAEGITVDARTSASARAAELFGFHGTAREIYQQLDAVLKARAWERTRANDR